MLTESKLQRKRERREMRRRFWRKVKRRLGPAGMDVVKMKWQEHKEKRREMRRARAEREHPKAVTA